MFIAGPLFALWFAYLILSWFHPQLFYDPISHAISQSGQRGGVDLVPGLFKVGESRADAERTLISQSYRLAASIADGIRYAKDLPTGSPFCSVTYFVDLHFATNETLRTAIANVSPVCL